jgi:mRNA-degrading endonuclease HigB of HigAB toxin-antitoxin module
MAGLLAHRRCDAMARLPADTRVIFNLKGSDDRLIVHIN